MKPYTKQDIDRAGEKSQSALATLAYWRGVEAKQTVQLAHTREELHKAEAAYQAAEHDRAVASAPGAMKPTIDDLQ